MLRSHSRHSYRIPYGLHRSPQIRPGRIRYSRSRLLYGQMMMGRPGFSPPSVPLNLHGFFGGILAVLFALCCSNRQKPSRSPSTSGGGGSTSGGGVTSGGGGATSGGGGGLSGCGGGGGGGSCGGGGGD